MGLRENILNHHVGVSKSQDLQLSAAAEFYRGIPL